MAIELNHTIQIYSFSYFILKCFSYNFRITSENFYIDHRK